MEKRSSTRFDDQAYRHHWISEAAYYQALARNFIPGHELDDWLSAENAYAQMQIERFIQVAREDGDMSLPRLQRLAQLVGIPDAESIEDLHHLIHAIQLAMGNYPCFHAEPITPCGSEECLWQVECKKLIARWRL